MTFREVVIACTSALIGYIAGRMLRGGRSSGHSRVTYSSMPVATPIAARGSWQVIMADAGPRKIEVIRIIRQVSGLGLKESKDLVEARPPVTVVSGLGEETARRLVGDLEQAGARATAVSRVGDPA